MIVTAGRRPGDSTLSRMLARLGVVLVLLLALSAEAAHATFPGSNGKIAFSTLVGPDPDSAQREVAVVEPDGSGFAVLTSGGAGQPEWSPDGGRIAFSTEARSGRDLNVMNADGSAAQELLPGALFHTWSPDGARLGFLGQANGGVFVVNSDGTGRRRLGDSLFAPAWSPDGRRLAYTDAQGGIYVVGVDGSGRRRLTPRGNSPAWSPSGRTIAYVDGGDAVATIGANGGRSRTIARAGAGMAVSDPTWSPDGRRLLYVAEDPGGFMGNEYVATDVHAVDADGSDRRRLTTYPGADTSADWSPDGRAIVFASDRDAPQNEDGPGPTEIYVMNADGSDQRRVTTSRFSALPDWQALPDQASARPVAGRTAVLRALRGEVLVRTPGAGEFVPLDGATSVPVGSLVDVRGGTVRVTAAADLGRRTMTGDFTGGIFRLRQRRARRPVTELVLTGGDFSACPSRGRARVARAIRRLRGSARGRFRTRGRNSSATVRGTRWTVEDRCEGTMTTVQSGTVVVRDFARRRNVKLQRGERYVARGR
jgi:Tol biopolymer transport system component